MHSLQVTARLTLALWLALAPVKAWAGSMTLLGAGGPSGVPFSITFGASATSTSPVGNVYTFSSQSIPNSDSTRTVYVGVGLAGCTTSCGISGVTVNGVAATQATGAFQAATTFVASDWWYAPCGTGCGTSTTVVVTTTTATGRVTIFTYSILGTGNAFSQAGGSSAAGGTSASATLTVPSGGGTIGFGSLNSGTGASFTNLTSDFVSSACCGSRVYAVGSNTSLSGSNTFTINFTGGGNAVSGSFLTLVP